LAIKHSWHAEDVSWPLKKTDETIIGKTVKGNFAADTVESDLKMAA